MAANSELVEGSVVITDKQTNGKGQRGNTWVSESGKNLTFTLMLKPAFLKIAEQFSMTMVISLAVKEVFEKFLYENDIKIKWPNDIYVNEKKCAGILIENSLKGNKIECMIVGIGMNINQGFFQLSKATSLFGETGKEFDLINVLEETLLTIEKYYLMLKQQGVHKLRPDYLANLLWRNEWHLFRTNEDCFTGKILGVDQLGRLVVETQNNQQTFDIKEISFVK